MLKTNIKVQIILQVTLSTFTPTPTPTPTMYLNQLQFVCVFQTDLLVWPQVASQGRAPETSEPVLSLVWGILLGRSQTHI